MWEVLVKTPLGTVSKRKLVMLVATFMVTVFGYLFINPSNVYAADAEWNGDDISYNAKDFTGPFTAVDNDRSTLPKDTIYYATYDATDSSSSTKPKGYLLYFAKGTDTTKAKNVLYSTAEYNPATGRFSNLSPPEALSLDESTYNSAATLQPSSCDVDGIGWIICPVSGWIAKGMDFIYGLIESYLTFTPLTGGTNGIYQMWDIVRNIANIMFTIGFLVLIYAQITGSLFSNYSLKKILPRIIIAAVLVNTSYWICAVGVDISNVAGVSVQQLFMNMFDQLGATNSAADDIGWEKVTALALGGGSLATIGLIGATAGGTGAFAFLLIAAIIPALFAVFVAVIILAARQALITILVILAPLAFVAYLLPNTEEWFSRWRKFFISLLVMFPAFAVVFGGSQLAGKLIIQNASNLSVVILGLVVQVVPLFVTPFLIKLSSGLLSTIIGLTNDKSKGAFDGARNWAKSNQELHKDRSMRNGFSEKNRTGIRRFRPAAIGARMANGSKHRENMSAAYRAQTEAGYYQTRKGQRAYYEGKFGSDQKAASDHANEESWQRKVSGDQLSTRRTPIGRNRENQRYQNHLKTLHGSHEAEGRANILSESIHDEGERHFRESIANAGAGTYEARLRDRQIQSTVDKGVGENAKKYVDTQGSAALKRTIANNGALSQQVAQTVRFEKTAEQYDTIVQKAAEAAYDDYSRANDGARNLRLRAVEATDTAKLADQQWNTVVEEAYAKGYTSPSIGNNDAVVADNLQYLQRQLAGEEKRIENAKFAQRRNIVTAFKDDTAFREYAGGVEGVAGATRIQAQVTKEFVDESVKAVMTNRSLTSQLTRNQLKEMLYNGKDADGNQVTTEMQQAAMYELLQEKGNNMDAQEIRDSITRKGFSYDENDRKFYEYKRDAAGRIMRGPDNRPLVDKTREVDASKAGDRRDWQQFFEDASKGSPHSIASLSGTNRSEGKAGNLVDDTRYGFIRDALGGKFGPEKLLKADFDELKLITEDIQNPNGEFQRLSAEDQAKFATAYESAVTNLQTHPSYKGQIDDRNRGVMNDTLARLNPSYATGRKDAQGNPIFDVREDNSIVKANSTDATRGFTAPIVVDVNASNYYRQFDPNKDIVDL
jgi:hypothetical protein